MKNLFTTYHKFSKISDIKLHNTKTEILRLGDEHKEREYLIVNSEGGNVKIKEYIGSISFSTFFVRSFLTSFQNIFYSTLLRTYLVMMNRFTRF